ncbi:hypothetical protein [Leptolinea tardivitalis]|uniref:SGNH hydrolase-type esterase domain-containing protein n=1 Tax=Leptolinea tardivitalis TaxID=229920 RepID=A0A0P6XNP9_9CHLR|nr:hypothetical protein [Leptolinea tardivitalis]KPL73693.1 hypothetical protein ADM99_02380 [Leptolinea tardivitalis]GAP22837.1 hypothetical protein LTAR_03079 [Leptolinea tardivitalis]
MKRFIQYISLCIFLTGCSTIGQAASLSVDPTAAMQTSVALQVQTLSVQQTDVARQVQTMSAALPTQTASVQPTQNPPTQPANQPSQSPTRPVVPTLTPGPSPTPENSLTSQGWGQAPIIPTVGTRAKEIYQRGLLMGNDPRHFSVAGDCQSVPQVFMGIFDGDRYRLSDADKALQETIDNFKGQFSRDGVAVRQGFGITSILDPTWSETGICDASETPLDCEFRVNKPSILFINMGTNWKNGNAEGYEKYLRQVVDICLEHGVLPILSSKIDNIEGDHSINKVTASVAHDYDLPYWNTWLAADSLPHHGLDSDRGDIYFSTDAQYVRELSGLRALDAVWRGVR